MTGDGDVESIKAQPETFAWRDGLTGCTRRYTPDFLVRRSDGTDVYREVKPLRVLRADPDFGGRRSRIELECRTRGADFEVWTEREIRRADGVGAFLRHATIHETAMLSATAGEDGGQRWGSGFPGSPLLEFVSRELGIADFRPCGMGWVGRSRTTGIAMAVMCDLHMDPETRMLVWKPGRMSKPRPRNFSQNLAPRRGPPRG